jgi:transketolase
VNSLPRLSAELDRDIVAIARGIAMDAPLKAKSGHQGTAMALAPLAHVLYSRIMRHAPHDPLWRNRDRFILSAGHASILQYAMLFLNGYGLELSDLQSFRQFDSLTPGHPEAGHTAGVEVTTGPLGQGFANAVGMAIAESNLRARFGSELMDHHTFVIAGDGCLMEGISHEAASLAGHLGLDRLICVYDDNKITIDGSTALTCSDDVVARFSSYGWNVVQLGEIGEDMDALELALNEAKQHRGSPTLCILQTHIGFPSPDFTDSHEAHGNPFLAEHVERTKAVLNIPNEPFWAPAATVAASREFAHNRSAQLVATYKGIKPNSDFEKCWSPQKSAQWTSKMPTFETDSTLATRQAMPLAISASLSDLPGLMLGSADLTGNTGVKIGALTAHSAQNSQGQQIYFGIREHAMAAAMVGMALHGGILPVGGTFFVFADYMRPSLRLAALSHAKAIFVFSHDSVGVGEDGPTHQPVEHLASLRIIPGLHVVRPADSNETAQAWRDAADYDGPTALILSRQSLPITTDGSAIATGAGVVRAGSSAAQIVLVGTGSEVSLCVQAATQLEQSGIASQVVSMPSWDRFETMSKDFKSTIFPRGVPVLSVEAGSTFGWAKYADQSIGIDRFGASAPGNVVMQKLGLNVQHVVDCALELIASDKQD